MPLQQPSADRLGPGYRIVLPGRLGQREARSADKTELTPRRTLTLRSVAACFKLNLWDEEAARWVGYRG